MAQTSRRRLPAVQIALRLAVIGVVLLAVLGAFAYASGAFSPGRLTQQAIVDRLQGGGVFPGFRRNHAKGVCVTGTFESNGAGAKLSRASVFAPGKVPVVGRFALAAAQPFVPDDAGTVRSFALRFALPDGQEWRTGMNDIPVFPVATPEGFYDLLAALAPDKTTGKPDPQAIGAFIGRHPEAGPAFGLIQASAKAPGFAEDRFNALNAFLFTAADGTITPVRWSVVPAQTADAAAPAPDFAPDFAQDKNALFDRLIAQVAAHPLVWRLVVTAGQAGDPTADPTLPWPAGRPTIDVGAITIDHAESEDAGYCRDINYDPLILPDGIAGSDDPILPARSAAYAVSFTRRSGEDKAPSAVQVSGGRP